jgi:hypothetical protein
MYAQIDMGGGSSDRTSKPKINNVRIEGHCFEILAEEPSPSALDGKREVEDMWADRVEDRIEVWLWRYV